MISGGDILPKCKFRKISLALALPRQTARQLEEDYDMGKTFATN